MKKLKMIMTKKLKNLSKKSKNWHKNSQLKNKVPINNYKNKYK